MTTHEIIETYYPEYHDIQRYPADRMACITKAANEWGILGNMTKCPLTVDGVTFPSSEHIYQIMRFNDTAFRKELLHEASAFSMKKFKVKKRIDETVPEWTSHLVDVMRYWDVYRNNSCCGTEPETCRTRNRIRREVFRYNYPEG